MSRHPTTEHMLKMLQVNPNLKPAQKGISQTFEATAIGMVNLLPDSPELTTGLRKLLEAKDCFVRASLDFDPLYYRDR